MKADIVERLEGVLVELRGLPLPAGSAGSSLLAVLEAVEEERQMMRTRAKALLSKAPGALPGWTISRNGAPEREKHEPTAMVIRSHHRRSAVRLIQRPRILNL